MARINLANVELAESLPTFEPMLKMAQANWGGEFTVLKNKPLAERGFGRKCATKRKAERRDYRKNQLQAVFAEEFAAQAEEFEG